MSDRVSDTDDQLRKEHGLDVQPAPVHNDLPSAHDLVAKDLQSIPFPLAFDLQGRYEETLDMFVDLAVQLDKDPKQMMEARKQFGLRKYGTLLQPRNGRKHLEDALDEIADALVYLRCEMYEGGVL